MNCTFIDRQVLACPDRRNSSLLVFAVFSRFVPPSALCARWDKSNTFCSGGGDVFAQEKTSWLVWRSVQYTTVSHSGVALMKTYLRAFHEGFTPK